MIKAVSRSCFLLCILRVFDGKLFMYKKCSKCKKEKLFSEFSKNNKRKSGYQAYCKSCRKDYQKLNSAVIKQKVTEYYIKNRDSLLLKGKIWHEENKEKIAIRVSLYEKLNKKKIAIQKNKYRQINRGKFNALAAKRRAAKLKATPKWLTSLDLQQIEELYEIAQAFKLYTGQEYHVDHIVPLQGKNVCGLHVPWNLQILEASENLSKHNKLLEC